MKTLKIVELCETDSKEKQIYQKRYIKYKVKSDNLYEAIKEYQEQFNARNIVGCNDEFEGECLNSETIEYKFS